MAAEPDDMRESRHFYRQLGCSDRIFLRSLGLLNIMKLMCVEYGEEIRFKSSVRMTEFTSKHSKMEES